MRQMGSFPRKSQRRPLHWPGTKVASFLGNHRGVPHIAKAVSRLPLDERWFSHGKQRPEFSHERFLLCPPSLLILNFQNILKLLITVTKEISEIECWRMRMRGRGNSGKMAWTTPSWWSKAVSWTFGVLFHDVIFNVIIKRHLLLGEAMLLNGKYHTFWSPTDIGFGFCLPH